MFSGTRRAERSTSFRPSRVEIAVGAVLVLIGVVLGSCEARTSALQAAVGSALAERAVWRLAPGCSDDIRFPSAGPYDLRHGYARMPAFRERLEARAFECESQVRFSRTLRVLAALGLPPPWREPPSAGLRVDHRRGESLFDARGAPGYPDYAAIPPLVAQSLLYVENRELLRDVHPNRNPVLEWDRLGRAGIAYLREKLGGGAAAAGGSTLAIQIEKFRHSPGGLTESPFEKLRQIGAASLRAYRLGPRTAEVRRELVVDYLDSLPLAAFRDAARSSGFAKGSRRGTTSTSTTPTGASARFRAADPSTRRRARVRTGAVADPRDAAADGLPDRCARAARRAHGALFELLERDGVLSADLRAPAAAAPLVRRRTAPPPQDRASSGRPRARYARAWSRCSGSTPTRSSTRSTCASRAASTSARSSAPRGSSASSATRRRRTRRGSPASGCSRRGAPKASSTASRSTRSGSARTGCSCRPTTRPAHSTSRRARTSISGPPRSSARWSPTSRRSPRSTASSSAGSPRSSARCRSTRRTG